MCPDWNVSVVATPKGPIPVVDVMLTELLTERQVLWRGCMDTSPKYRRLSANKCRDQILDAANALLAERGYEEVTVEHIARSAGVARGLVHHYFGGRREVYLALLERVTAGREEDLRPPRGRSARARVADSVSRWLDWTEANATIYLGTIAPSEDIADPDVRRAVATWCTAPSRMSQLHADIAEDSPTCATRWSAGPVSTGPRREAGCAARPPARPSHELLDSTLERILRTFARHPERVQRSREVLWSQSVTSTSEAASPDTTGEGPTPGTCSGRSSGAARRTTTTLSRVVTLSRRPGYFARAPERAR